jgi:magnesium transporter
MPRLFTGQRKAHGLIPGEAVHVGRKKVEHALISVIRYDEHQIQEQRIESVVECPQIADQEFITWINIDGLHQVELLEQFGERFGLHPLVIEDILNTDQRPKLEDYDEYLFIVLKSLYHSKVERDEAEIEQISLVLGPSYVLSFQERAGDEFGPVRDRIRNNKGRVRKMGADYLAYALIDLIVDTYFIVLERLGERMETLEEELVTAPTSETLQAIHQLKREMIFTRKSTWPLREVIGALERGESPLIQGTTGVYLRDVYDHTIQVIDAVETYRDMLSGMLDIYLSSISNRMNEVMKVLTIIATVFIPLTFIAGVYGMNFQHMPELAWPWAYPMVWLVMIVIAGAMLVYFQRKRWL